MPKQILRDSETRMEKAVEVTAKDFSSIRTGRASPSLLDNLQIDYYGTKSPIKQVATITAPEPRLLVIQPWDKTIIKEIEKAITRSDLGLNPSSDKNVIRLTIPQLTEERRQNLAKHVRKLAEEGRIAIRNIRRDANDAIKKLEKSSEISEDESRMHQDEIQELTDLYIEEIDELLKSKEEELLEV
jgi:ribosome recycling factor